MLISDEYKFIFIHIPKTGGSSVKEALKEIGVKRTKLTRLQRFKHYLGLNKNYKEHRFRTHGNLQSVEKVLPKEIFDSYTKFSVVRSPWGRLVSEYEFFKKGSEVYQNVLKRRRHRWARGINTFEDFVYAKAAREDATQFYYLKDLKNNLGMDVVLKQESLYEDFDRLCWQLGINCQLTRYNTTREKSPIEDYFSQELDQFVIDKWHKDIQLFDYQSPLQRAI